MGARRLVGLLIGVAACSREVAFTVDASAVAADEPGALLRVVLVHYGAIDEELRLDFAEGEVSATFETPLLTGVEYGVAAYADLDRDGHCTPAPIDLPWLFTYLPARGVDLVWEPDPEESPDAFVACSWFGDPLPGEGSEDPSPPL